MWPILFFLGCFGLGFVLGRKTRLFAKREPLVAHMTVPRGTAVTYTTTSGLADLNAAFANYRVTDAQDSTE